MQRKELTKEVLRTGGVTDRLDNAPRPKLREGRWNWDRVLVPQPKPVDYSKTTDTND